MCNSKQQRTRKKTAFHSQGIEHHGSFESIGSPRTWHLCHWNLKPFWQCFKEACWGLLPSPVCKFAQSMSVYIFMGNPTELQKAWRQAPCATFVVPIVDKKGCWHEFLDTWDPAVSWHLCRAIYWPHCDHHLHWLLTTFVCASNCSLTIAHPTTSQHNNHAFCSLNWSVHNSRRQQNAKLLNLYDYFSVPLLMFWILFMQLVTMWLQIKSHNISLLSLWYTSRWEDEQMYVLARHKIIPTP